MAQYQILILSFKILGEFNIIERKENDKCKDLFEKMLQESRQ
jgi:hypothetical protein